MMEAMLGYADAYIIYDEFDSNHSQKGVCLANLGSIAMQLGSYQEACIYTYNSIQSVKNIISELNEKYENSQNLSYS